MDELGKLGPAMQALPNDRWRDACVAFVEGGAYGSDHGYTDAIKKAGFEGTPNSLRVTAHRIFHDHRMQAAVQEEARKRLTGLVPLAIRAHREIMEDPFHKDRAVAAKSIFDRAGLHVVTEHRENIGVVFSVEQKQRAVLLAKRLGIPLDKLVGPNMVREIERDAIEAEYEDVPANLEDVL